MIHVAGKIIKGHLPVSPHLGEKLHVINENGLTTGTERIIDIITSYLGKDI